MAHCAGTRPLPAHMSVSVAGMDALPKASADAEDAASSSDTDASSDSEPPVATAAALSAAGSLQRSLSLGSQKSVPVAAGARGGAAWAGSDWAAAHNAQPAADATCSQAGATSGDEAGAASTSQVVAGAAARGPGKCGDCGIKCDKNWFRCALGSVAFPNVYSLRWLICPALLFGLEPFCNEYSDQWSVYPLPAKKAAGTFRTLLQVSLVWPRRARRVLGRPPAEQRCRHVAAGRLAATGARRVPRVRQGADVAHGARGLRVHWMEAATAAQKAQRPRSRPRRTRPCSHWRGRHGRASTREGSRCRRQGRTWARARAWQGHACGTC